MPAQDPCPQPYLRSCGGEDEDEGAQAGRNRNSRWSMADMNIYMKIYVDGPVDLSV